MQEKMKFVLLGFLVIFLMGLSPVSTGDNIHLSAPNENVEDYNSTLPSLRVTDSGKSGVTMVYNFKGAVLSPKEVDGTLYHMPHIYGFSHMNDVGSPRLPAKNHHIAILSGSTASIEIIDARFKEQSEQYAIHPTLELQPDCQGSKEARFGLNRQVYETDADFPGNIVELVEVDSFMGAPIAVVQVRPMQFNPVTGKLKIYSKIKFKVTFSGKSSSDLESNSKHSNRMVRNAVLNRKSIPKGVDRNENFEVTKAANKDYIMIVHSDYLSAARDLATWKRQMGYSVEIVSQSSWSTTQIKSELDSRYTSWNPKPLYFLLFGDQGDVPAEYTGSRYTDLYYAEMDGSGYKPEMAYGRIFASTSTNAQIMVDKIINYEKNPPTVGTYYTRALACAYYQDSDNNSYADRRFAHTSEDLRTYVMGRGYSVNRVYVTGSSVDPEYYNDGYYSPSNTPVPSELRRPTFAWDGDYADIINYIDGGRFLVWHRDHGDVTLWGDPYFTTSNINQLNNGNLLPIVMSVNCLTGQFTGSTECFCERFLRRDGGGCVGIFGATELSYSGPNDGYAPGIIDAIWPVPGIDPQYGSGGAGNSIPAHDPIYTMGDILNHSKVAMEYLWGTHQTTWELHHYYGDPAMKIWTAEPANISASHDTVIAGGGTSFDITSSNCGGGLATLVYEDTLVGKTTLAGDGTGTITFTTLSGAEPTAILTISKHNYKPYIADISVGGGAPPVADFTADDTSVMAGDTVNFTDLSSNNPTSWSWTFTGGTPSSSTAQNPSITYNSAGVYTVSLTATNTAGNDTETKTNYITVTALQAPVADFTASDTSISEGDSVTFTDTSTGNPDTWSWTFTGGTPASSTAQNPTVTYNTAGTYTVALTASNAAGGDTETKTDYITVTEVLPTVGNTTVYSSTSTSANRRAMPFSMPENGTISSVTIYHSGGSGDIILAVYDGEGSPDNRIAITAQTALNSSAGWQTIDLVTPVYVSSGTTIWLAWVFESNPGIAYTTGTPGRVDAGVAWSGGMPDPYGSGTQADFLYSIYATYTPGGGPVQYTLTTNTVGQGSITLDPPGGVYDDGTVVTLTADPASGWQFDGWSGDLNGSTNPTTITMNSNKSVTATFSEIGTTNTVGHTNVFSSNTTTANRRAMPFTMPENGTISSVTMYHTGGSGSMILGVYSGEGSPANRLGQTPETAVSGSTGWQTINLATPVYAASGTTVWLAWVYENNPGIAYESGSPGRVDAGEAWSGRMPDPFGTSTQANYIYSIYATYTPGGTPPQYTLTTNTVGQGSIILNPAGGTYDQGTVVTLTADPASGWQFDVWSGDLNGSTNPTTITMNENKNVTATFSEIGTTATVGNTSVFSSNSVSTNRRAMPFTMTENGTITSVSMYHQGGSGSMILAVYDGEGLPADRIAVTAETTVSGSTGWQTINLTSPVYVASGTTVWLAWVYESNPGIAYETGSPGRVDAGEGWSGGMPDPYGSGTQANYLYSIYATYNVGSARNKE